MLSSFSPKKSKSRFESETRTFFNRAGTTDAGVHTFGVPKIGDITASADNGIQITGGVHMAIPGA